MCAYEKPNPSVTAVRPAEHRGAASVSAKRHPARGVAVFRFTLSLRDVEEEMLAEREIELSYETIRCWIQKSVDRLHNTCAGAGALPAAAVGLLCQLLRRQRARAETIASQVEGVGFFYNDFRRFHDRLSGFFTHWASAPT